MNDLTLCTVSHNALYSASLMWESYCTYHERPLFFVFDNHSTDGTAEYLMQHADYFYASPVNIFHGRGLDCLCAKVTTKYLLTIDTDIELKQSVVPLIMQVMEDTGAFAVSQPLSSWKFNDLITINGEVFEKEKRYPVWLTMFRTEELKKILKNFSFSACFNRDIKKFYDTSSMVYLAAKLLELESMELDIVDTFKHYTGITNVLYCPKIFSEKLIKTKTQAYKTIKTRLENLRKQ